MAFLLALSFLTYFDRVCIMRVQADIQAELHIDDGGMALIFGAFWLAYAIFEIPAGWLGDRFGARLALTRVVLAWSLFTALTGLAGGFTSLLAIRFLFGAGEAGAFPNMARVQSSWLNPAARGRAGGWLWLAARWGGAFSPFVFAAMIRWLNSTPVREILAVVPGLAEMSGWRLGFLTAGLVGVIWCIAFYPWFRNDPASHKGVNAAELAVIRASGGRQPPGFPGENQGADASRAPSGIWRALFTSRSLWALMLLYTFGSFGWSFFVSWMPRYLKDAHGIAFNASEQVWKQPLLYGGASCLLGGLISDWLVRRTGRKRLARALLPVGGCLAAAIAIFSLRFVDNPNTAIVLMCVAGAAYDFGQAANWATIVDVGGRFAGIATGLINLGNIGQVIQPWVGAKLFNTYDWNTLLAALAGAFLLAAAMWMFIDPRRTFYDSEPSC
jgi:MFS family permease